MLHMAISQSVEVVNNYTLNIPIPVGDIGCSGKCNAVAQGADLASTCSKSRLASDITIHDGGGCFVLDTSAVFRTNFTEDGDEPADLLATTNMTLQALFKVVPPRGASLVYYHCTLSPVAFNCKVVIMACAP